MKTLEQIEHARRQLSILALIVEHKNRMVYDAVMGMSAALEWLTSEDSKATSTVDQLINSPLIAEASERVVKMLQQ